MNILLKNRIALQSIKIWLSLAFFFITSMVFAATPAATDNLGLIGNAYYLGNLYPGTQANWDKNWNGTGNVTTDNYAESPVTSGTDVYWKFDNVRMKEGGEFRFWVGRVWTTSLEYNDFNSRIFVPMGTTVGQVGQNLKINTTPGDLDTQYDIIVKKTGTTFYIYLMYSRIGLNGNCYYKGNRTDAFKHTSLTTNNLNWKASTDEGYEIEPEVVASSGTYPACRYTYTFTGVILNRFSGSEPGISFMVDNDGAPGGRLVASQGIVGSASGAFAQKNYGVATGWPNQDVWEFKGVDNNMYTITWTLDYTGSTAPGNPNTISAIEPGDADWLAYRMGIMGGAYYIENDTNQVTTWSKNWSNARAKTTYDVAPVLSGTGNRYVTWTFNGVIMRNGEAFKLRHEQNWNGRNIGFNSTQAYSNPGNVLGSATPITSTVTGAGFADGSKHNITLTNPILSGVVPEPNWIYKLVLQLDRTTGIYNFGVDKTTANWVGGDVTVGMTDNVETGWRNPLNWDIDVAPMRNTDVIVDKKTYQPIITSSATCNTLTIAATAGANVSVNPNAMLDVRNIVNSVPSNGVGIILNNNVRKQAILYNYGTYTNAGGGLVQVNTVLDQDTTYALGHEVSGANVLADNYNTQTISVYRYNTTTDGWDQLANGEKLTTADRINTFENSPVTGYALRNKSGATKTLSYSGIPMSNSANYTTVIPYNSSGAVAGHRGYYLIANPYTTYLNLEALYTAGGFSDGNLEKTVWVPHRSKTDATTWEMYNFAGSVGVVGGRVSALANRNIPPAQAFWVLSKATSSFTFKPSCRVAAIGAGQQSLKSLTVGDEPNDVFRFGSNSPGLQSQMALLFREIGTSELTTNDSHNFNGLDGIFSMKGGEEVAINLLPLLTQDTIIDLGYRYSGSSAIPVILEAQSLSLFNTSIPVFLEDRQEGEIYDLRETPNVSVYLTSGLNTSRFALHFIANNGIITTIPKASNPTSVIHFRQNNETVVVSISNSNEVNGIIQVVNLAGDVVITMPILSDKTDLVLPSSNNLYVVRVISNVGTKSEKFIVR